MTYRWPSFPCELPQLTNSAIYPVLEGDHVSNLPARKIHQCSNMHPSNHTSEVYIHLTFIRICRSSLEAEILHCAKQHMPKGSKGFVIEKVAINKQLNKMCPGPAANCTEISVNFARVSDRCSHATKAESETRFCALSSCMTPTRLGDGTVWGKRSNNCICFLSWLQCVAKAALFEYWHQRHLIIIPFAKSYSHAGVWQLTGTHPFSARMGFAHWEKIAQPRALDQMHHGYEKAEPGLVAVWSGFEVC